MSKSSPQIEAVTAKAHQSIVVQYQNQITPDFIVAILDALHDLLPLSYFGFVLCSCPVNQLLQFIWSIVLTHHSTEQSFRLHECHKLRAPNREFLCLSTELGNLEIHLETSSSRLSHARLPQVEHV